jgi:hypothetical protein
MVMIVAMKPWFSVLPFSISSWFCVASRSRSQQKSRDAPEWTPARGPWWELLEIECICILCSDSVVDWVFIQLSTQNEVLLVVGELVKLRGGKRVYGRGRHAVNI